MRMQSLFQVGAAVAALWCLAPTAQASDAKTYPGSMCETQTPGTDFWRSDKAFTANSAQWVSCPILRDNIGTTGGLSKLQIYGRSAQFQGGSYCYARSMAVNGGGVKRSEYRYLPDYGDYADAADWGSSMNSGYANGLYAIECYLKAGAHITQINYEEP